MVRRAKAHLPLALHPQPVEVEAADPPREPAQGRRIASLREAHARYRRKRGAAPA